MIHWSLCTPAAGRFYGEKVRNSEYAEWIRCHNKVQKADWDKMAKRMTDIVLPDYPFEVGDEVVVLVSGLGATPVMELYVLYNEIDKILKEKGII